MSWKHPSLGRRRVGKCSPEFWFILSLRRWRERNMFVESGARCFWGTCGLWISCGRRGTCGLWISFCPFGRPIIDCGFSSHDVLLERVRVFNFRSFLTNYTYTDSFPPKIVFFSVVQTYPRGRTLHIIPGVEGGSRAAPLYPAAIYLQSKNLSISSIFFEMIW